MRQIRLAIIVIGILVAIRQTAVSQFTGYQRPITPAKQMPKTYTDYYVQNLQQYHKPQANVRDYTIDRYYYHNPSLSPYLNLTRRSGASSLNNYYRYVRPEIERRSQSNLPNALPTSPRPSFNSNPYFNHY